MLSQKVVFKGVRDGILVIVDTEATREELLACLTEHARLGKDFFGGATALMCSKNGDISKESVEAVTGFLVSEMGFGAVKAVPALNKVTASIRPSSSDVAEHRSDEAIISPLNSPTADATMFVKRTLRSGQRVNYIGHVIIMGDVNPGAEVVAGGDIIVLGSLRGVAHAGATGTDTSSVFALRLQPTQLRIANFIARPPDGDNRVPTAPEVASIKDGRLVIEAYNASMRA